MNYLLVIVSCALISSCGINPFEDVIEKKVASDPRTNLDTNLAFSYYVNIYETDYKEETGIDVDVSYIPINFGDISEVRNAIGVCYVYNLGSGVKTREIKINESWWNIATNDSREALIKHELGHCHLDRVHDDSIHSKGYKRSLMNSSIVNSSDFNKFRTGYDKELFTEDKSLIDYLFDND